jgi:hypothetical protein
MMKMLTAILLLILAGSTANIPLALALVLAGGTIALVAE